MSFLEKVEYSSSPLYERSRNLVRATLFKFVGILLFAIFAFSFGSLITYSKNDPSFRNANDKDVENIFGVFGSYFADSIHMAIGLSMFLLPLFFLFWSGRFIFQRNSKLFFKRLLFMPFCLASSSLFVSSNKPFSDSPFEYGLGGIF